jgi:hypothetical protein
MKRNLLSKTQKQTILAIPAAALMLGASHGATIGIHYTENWGAYAANGNGSNTGTYGTTGYYAYGYMTTGMNVTGTAFGVPASNWSNLQVSSYVGAFSVTNTVGPMTVISTAADAECSGIGNTNFVYADYDSWFVAAGVQPGNDQVTWAYLDDNTKIPGPDFDTLTYTMWNVQLSGMKAAHPNGYTIQTISYPWIFDTTQTPSAPAVHVSDLATFTNTMDYTDLGARQGAWGQGISHAGLSSVSAVMTADVVNIFADPPWVPAGDYDNNKNAQRVHSTLCGFIISDATASAPLTLQIVGNNVVWSAGTLQSSPGLGTNAVWTTLTNAVSPYPVLPSVASKMFFRLKQ